MKFNAINISRRSQKQQLKQFKKEKQIIMKDIKRISKYNPYGKIFRHNFNYYDMLLDWLQGLGFLVTIKDETYAIVEWK